jgi:biopolymer transport protein ExbD
MMKIGSESEDGLLTEMNTTPLIDVMLVLLVMLIITIPMQLHSVNMNLPKAANSEPLVKPVTIKLEITASNQILWNGTPVADKTALQALLDAASKASTSLENQPDIHIKPSDSAQYDTVAAVLAATQRSGLKKIGMVSTETLGRLGNPGNSDNLAGALR